MTNTLNLPKFFILFILACVFVVPVSPVQAQFSDSWDFMKAVKEQNYNDMMAKLNKGANVNVRDADGKPTIVIASDLGNQRLIRFLLDHGANVNASVEGSGETALLRRADAGDMDTINLLLEYKADLNAINNTGETALIRAVRARKRHVVKGLIKAGADMGWSDYTGRTALDYAEETRSLSLIKIVKDGLEGKE